MRVDRPAAAPRHPASTEVALANLLREGPGFLDVGSPGVGEVPGHQNEAPSVGEDRAFGRAHRAECRLEQESDPNG